MDEILADYFENKEELTRLREENAQLREQLANCAHDKIVLHGQVRNLLYQGEN